MGQVIHHELCQHEDSELHYNCKLHCIPVPVVVLYIVKFYRPRPEVKVLVLLFLLGNDLQGNKLAMSHPGHPHGCSVSRTSATSVPEHDLACKACRLKCS